MQQSYSQNKQENNVSLIQSQSSELTPKSF